MRTADNKPMFGGITSFLAGLVAGTMEAIFVTTPQARPLRCPRLFA